MFNQDKNLNFYFENGNTHLSFTSFELVNGKLRAIRKNVPLRTGTHLLSFVSSNLTFDEFYYYCLSYGLDGFLRISKTAGELLSQDEVSQAEYDDKIEKLYYTVIDWLYAYRDKLHSYISTYLYIQNSNTTVQERLIYEMYNSDFRIDQLSLDCTIIPQLNTRVTEKKTRIEIEYAYSSQSIYPLLVFEFLQMLQHNTKVTKCICCSRFFFPDKGNKFCNITLIDGKHTCRELKNKYNKEGKEYLFSNDTGLNSLSLIKKIYSEIYEQKERLFLGAYFDFPHDVDSVSFDQKIIHRINHANILMEKEEVNIDNNDYYACYKAFIATCNSLIDEIESGDYLLRYNLVSIMISASNPVSLDRISSIVLSSSPFLLYEYFEIKDKDPHSIGPSLPVTLFTAELFDSYQKANSAYFKLINKYNIWDKEIEKLNEMHLLSHNDKRFLVNTFFDKMFKTELQITKK